MEISYKLEHFEGPLDLLLHLIEKNKVNIYDIPIVEITEQYLDYVNHMEKEDLNVVSEFLVMAATLLDIKARMLLPAEVDEETGEEKDPRAELVARLLEYKKFKYMALALQDREDGAGLHFYKNPTIPREVARYEPPVDLDKLLGDLTLARLQEIFHQVMRRQEDKIDRVRSNFGVIRKEPVSLEEKIGSVMAYARKHKTRIILDLDYRTDTWNTEEEASVYYHMAALQSDMVIGTREEFNIMEKMFLSGNGDDKTSAEYLLKQGVECVSIKRGRDGSCIYTKEGICRGGVYPVKAVKTFGAGDAYSGAFHYGIINGFNMEKCLKYAAAAASITISGHSCSDSTPTLEQVEKFITENHYIRG